MEITRDLGKELVTSKTGNTRKRHYCLFRCPVCNEDVKIDIYYGKKANTCNGCRGTQIKPLSHGMTGTPPYIAWNNMKSRCDNESADSYDRYGARGISYTPKWKTFESFWADMGETYKDGLTIDRIDNNGNYYKDNCQWITKSENCGKDKLKKVAQFELDLTEDKSYTRTIATFGSVIEASEKTGVTRGCIARCCRGERHTASGFGWRYID